MSAYTKTQNTTSFIQGGDVPHIDEKKAAQLLRLSGLTYRPGDLLRHGSIGSIKYKGKNIKINAFRFPIFLARMLKHKSRFYVQKKEPLICLRQ